VLAPGHFVPASIFNLYTGIRPNFRPASLRAKVLYLNLQVSKGAVIKSCTTHTIYNKELKTLKRKAKIFDIETTGLTAADEIICFTYGGVQYIQPEEGSEKNVLTELSEIVLKQDNHLLVTFFGGPKYGTALGFDIPTLRTRYLMNGVPELFPFHGHSHIDMSEVALKYFNTMVLQEPTLESLSAAQVVELTKECDLHSLKTKDANIQQLRNEETVLPIMVTEFIKKHVEPKAITKNSLDSIFKIYCPGADESLLNEKYSGREMPELFRRYKELNSTQCGEEILKHNRNCHTKIQFLYDCFIESGLVSALNIPTTRL